MRHLYILAAMANLIIAALFPATSGYKLGGYIGASVYLNWNLYAYLNDKRMLPPMNYGIDFSAGGDKTARAIFAAFCLMLLVTINVLWIGQRIA